MDAYWARRRTSATRTCCAALAGELGLPADDVDEVLDGDRYRDRVEASTPAGGVARAQRGVPAFVLDRRLLVLGAQPEEVFEQAFERLRGGRLSTASSTSCDDGFGWHATSARSGAPRMRSPRTDACWLIDPMEARASRSGSAGSASRPA